MKNIDFLLLCLFPAVMTAQTDKKSTIEWGFSLGLETQSLGIESLSEGNPEEIWVEADRNKPGVTVGLVGQKKIWTGLGFQSGVSLSHTYNKVGFHPDGPQNHRFTDLELPLYLTVTNQKKAGLPIKARLLFGPRIGWNLAQNPNDRLQLFHERLGLDLGLGMELKAGKWKICPEAIYSHGMNNLHDFLGTKYDFLVGRVLRDKLAFRVVFMR